MNSPHSPDVHYDRVTASWQLLLGNDLHYGVFNDVNESLSSATARLTELMIEAAALQPGVAVLDVGCGIGTPAQALAKRFGVRVLGITTSGVGVRLATMRAAEAGLSELLRFEQRDGTNTGLPDGAFDCVWVLESSHLMDRRDRLMAEGARVLRPGGRLVLCDITRQRPIGFAELRERSANFATLRTAFGQARMEPLAEYARLAETVGLVVEECRDLTQETFPTFAHWRANATQHREVLLGTLGLDNFHAFVQSTEILEKFWLDGTLGYGLLSARKT